jgi:hypothetical protein
MLRRAGNNNMASSCSSLSGFRFCWNRSTIAISSFQAKTYIEAALS